MQRTTASGATAGNQFTNGNPSTGLPATVIDATWLNSVQEEICSVIAGATPAITLDVSQQSQLLKAIQAIANQGAAPVAYLTTISNNQVAPANVAGLVFDNTKVKGARILFSIHRQTDLGTELEEQGQIWITYQPVAAQWRITEQSFFDDSGVIFSITSAGQIQYTSSNLAVSSTYVGQMRVSDVILINL